jgi:hypothetical protein
MTKFGDQLRARFAQRLAERSAEASGAVAGKLPVAGPPPVASPGAAPPANAPKAPSKKKRPRTWKAAVKEQVRVLNLAAQGGAFAEPLETYRKKRRAAEAARGRKQKTPAYKKAAAERVNEYNESIFAIARGLLDEPLDPRVTFKWTSRRVGPRFRIKKDAK